MYDAIIEDRLRKERDQFIASISSDDVLRLASSHHNGDDCEFFEPPRRGSFNICYFVRFANGDSWVVRIPLDPYLPFGAGQKVEREVATMKFVEKTTTIPIPRIIAYSSQCHGDLPGATAFMIIEFVDGQPLSDITLKTLSDEQRCTLYESLADIYIQLRRATFPSIGMLSCLPSGEIEVGSALVSIDINTAELQGDHPSRFHDFSGRREGIISSATQYITLLAQLTYNSFEQCWGSVVDEEDARKSLYYVDNFFHFIKDKWIDPELDRGPFVLAHGDLYRRNIIVDENMAVVALLDWEWSGAVPLQLFHPPTWLTDLPPRHVAYRFIFEKYEKELAKLCAIIERKESEKYGQVLLAKEWSRMGQGILAAEASLGMLEFDVFWKSTRDGYLPRPDLIDEFMKRDKSRGELVAKKVNDREAYEEECRRQGLAGYIEETVDIASKEEKPHLAEMASHYFFDNAVVIGGLGGLAILVSLVFIMSKRSP